MSEQCLAALYVLPQDILVLNDEGPKHGVDQCGGRHPVDVALLQCLQYLIVDETGLAPVYLFTIDVLFAAAEKKIPKIGRLNRSWSRAGRRGWVVV